MLPFRRGAAWQTLFLLCALAYCINEASSEGRVVCYYTNWSVYRPGTAKFNPQNINPYLCTHLVYAFGGFTKDNQMKPFDKYQDIEQGGYAKFTGLKTYNKQLKTMIAIGGWNEASSRFSPLVASNERRQQFIKNILKFLRQNHFDGIDLDWEYPAHREGGKSRDRDNYAQFVQELRAEFEREAQKTGRTRLLLTMAVPAGIEYIDKGYDVPKLNKYLDWFNVLTYDFHSSHEPSVNHHAPLYSLEEDSEYNYDAELNIDYSIKYYLKAGADRDKLVLGIPTYGRSYTLINEESTELGAPAEGPGEQGDATREKGYLAYYEICQTLKDDPEWTVVQPNANVMGPYAYRRNQWVGYDDEAMVRKKAEYVVAHGLGGIMFWAIDNDDFRGTCNGKPYPLIEAAKEAMVDALGLGINEVAKPSGPQKPSRSRSRDNAGQNRNRLNAKTEPPTPANSRRGSSGGRRTSTSTAAPPPSTTFRLTEAEGSSLYIGGRGSTTPPPPTTPDPGSDFKCEEEGFFQHPRDCKKYYWCLDSGPSGLGIVAHQFTCPSGLYFNPAADSCDFARNVPCKTKKSTTASPPVTSTTTTTTTARPNRVTAAPPARPIYAPRTTSSTTSTTTTAAPAAEDELEYEEEGGSSLLTDEEQSPGEEDPQVIKELIDLIRKVGGVEQLEKHLLRNKDGSITLKENSASGAPTTPSTISKSLYDRVLSRPGTLNSFTRNRLRVSETPAAAAAAAATPETRTESSSNSNSNYSKYSSVLRGNSRQGPQNEGIEKLTEFDGFLKERKQYVTINRHRSSSQGEAESDSESEEAAEEQSEGETTTRRPISAATPSYTSLRRARPSTTATPAAAELSQEQEEEEEESLSQVKSYASLSRQRGRGTSEKSEATTTSSSTATESTTNRYKYLERTRPTKSGNSGVAAAAEEAAEEDDEEYEDEQQQNVTVQSKQSLTGNQNTRKYASIGRSRTTTTTTETTPETTTTTTTKGTETAKASTTTNNSSYNVKQNNNKNNNNNNHQTIPTTTAESTTTPPPQPQSPSTTTTQPETTTNETTEPIESTTTTSTNQQTSPNTPTPTTTPTPTPILGSTTNSIDSDSLATIEPLGDATPTIPLVLDIANSTTTEPELGTTTTTTPTTTTATVTITGNTERNDVDVDDSDDSEVTKTKKQYTKYAATNRRRVTTTTITTPTTTNSNSEAAIDASRNGLNSISNTNVNSIRTNYSGRRQPQRTTTNTQTTTTTEPQPLPTTNPNNTLGSVSSPRPFGYPRRRTRPTVPSTTSTTTINDSNSNDNSNDNANSNDKQITDAVVNVVKKTRLSQVDRPKNRFQLSRTRGSSSTANSSRNSTTESGTSTTAATPTTTRRFAFGSRQRTQQVTKLTQVDDDEQTEENEQTKDSQESSQEDTTTAATITTTTTSNSNNFSKPTPKRIRVLKFRRPINTTENSTATNSATESTENHTNSNTVNTTLNTTETTPTTVNTNNTKRFRKIVRKLRPVEVSTSSSPASGAEESSEDGTTTTRKPFVPSHTRFAGGESQDNDLLNLRQRLKEQQAKGEPLDGVLSTRLKPASGLAQKSGAEDQDISELQRLRDKVKAEQARGTGEQGVINDRLKKLLAEKSEKSDKSEIGSNNEATPATEVSSRPFFKRKLVARRPYTPAGGAVAAGGATTTTKAPLSFNSSRPTPKFVRRKNGRFDPFNSSVRNRGEGFVRSDPRGSRLPGADRFKTQKGEDDGDDDDDDNAEEEQSEEAVEAQQEQPQNNRPLGASGVALRRPFVPKARNQPQSQKSQNEESEEEDEEEEEDEDDEEDEEEDNNNDNEEAKSQTEEGSSSSGGATPKPKFNNPYRPKDNRALPGSRPSFAPTAGGSGPGTGPGGSNVPYNPRGRQPNSSTANGSGSVAGSRFGGSTKRPRVVNRPPGVATPNLTLRPVASDYERTTPLTPLKPAPFIPSNTRSYERKYTGPSTEATETASENSLIEELNIDALNARNKKIFDINSKKHTTLKPKVVKVETVETETEVETGTEMETTEQVAQEQEQEQGYVTTTPSTPPTTTQPDTSTNNTTTDTTPSIETDNETTAPPPQILPQNPPPTNDNETHNANEAPSSLPQDLTVTGGAQLSTSTTQSPPPATTLLHVFTLLEGEGEGDEQAASTSTSRPPAKSYPASVGRQTIAEPKHKLIEINRIVEINSKQAKAAQRKSKANQQDFGMLRVESLPHVEQLGEISVVKYVHLVDGSAIQINDGHSTVADYTPTEPTATSDYRSLSAPVRNTLPLSEADTGAESEAERSGKSLLPEVISGALETSTISLEGLFDSARKGKQLNSNSILQDTEETTTMESETTVVPPTAAAIAAQATYVRPIVPLLRPESNESSPLVISIANLDKVILSKVQKSLAESKGAGAEEGTTIATDVDGDDDADATTTTSTITSNDSNSAFSVRHASVLQAPIDTEHKTQQQQQETTKTTQTTTTTIDSNKQQLPLGSGAISGRDTATTTTINTQQQLSSNNNNNNSGSSNTTQTTTTTTATTNNMIGSSVSEIVSYSTETHVVHRKKKAGRKGRGRRLRKKTTTTTAATTTSTTTDDDTTVVPLQ
ncbi:serine-rich adhesin for platelets isoform X1 [Drosophila subobscura]|uniref:serine-rich adhesin for platelets isoform X1 n=1 Tax=Drosophila subobscura TaxID=7241 RepID=UPI00155A377A|nr:serine-rich adhesin for platelets isoform X1 [Drosophila subobscura]